ncbi:hypothetical protein GCM10011369_02210 [Neiella marina]|uniref:Uncharacterized protein n=1 Tax=Neiella marina TaxID=508461 RepID=A0A8J2U1V3_9GAMM|nr:hypothetical protein [Neiella marina]GGA64415.1 hypothetical protein GCM10011369_02210 [Neiella marina]
MLKANVVLSALGLMIVTSMANGQDWQAEWQLCASVKNDQQRLLCYDRIGARYGLTAATTTISEDSLGPSEQSSELAAAMVPAEQSQAAAMVSGHVDAEPVVTVDSSPEEQFGLEQQIIKQEVKKLEAITGIVTAVSKDAYGKLTLGLDNEQRWKLQSKGPRISKGDTVIIERGTLGSFYLRKEGSSRTSRAKRLE